MTTMTALRRNRIRGPVRRQCGGFTLVEILVALTLLLIGIYAALRIFPVGFRVTESSQNRIWAANLARAELERVKLSAASLPDAIIVTDPFGEVVDAGYFASIGGYDTVLPPDPSKHPNALTPRIQAALGLLTTNPGWEPDCVYLPRMIVGESVTIPFVETGDRRAAGGWLVPIHLLNFAPIDYLRYDSSGEPTGDPIQIRSTLYQPVNDLYLLADLDLCSRHYYVEYANRRIYFRACDHDRRVAIDYTYLDTDGRSHDVLFNPITISAGAAPGRLWTMAYPLPEPPGSPLTPADRVVRGSVRVYEVFEFDGFLPPGADPPSPEAGHFMMEQLHDDDGNWVGAAGKIYFSTADAGRTVKIDYRVRDWGIVREDRRIEGNKIALSVPFVAADDTYANQPRLPNPVAFDGAKPVYIVAVRLSDGITLYPGETRDFDVDSRKGELKFHSDAATDGTEVRVLYRTENHWSVQVMKPTSVYYRDPATGPEAWPGFQYFLWGDQNQGAGPELFFSPEYAGMMVTADYQRRDNNRWVFGELHKIALEDTPKGPLGKITLEGIPVDNSFITVRGASVRVRTLWTERGRAQALNAMVLQGSDPDPREMSGRYLAEAWRAVNLDTQLTKTVAWGTMP